MSDFGFTVDFGGHPLGPGAPPSHLSFLRIFQHLLPTGKAWRLTPGKQLRQFFEGLAEPLADAREFIDANYLDLFPTTTRLLAQWEQQFGLTPSADASEDDRRLALASAWQAQGGQSPSYLQTSLRAAGFDVYVHEWWEPPNEAPRVVRNPRDYTDDPTFGDTQCGDTDALCGEPGAQCNRFLANEPGYLVNSDLTRVAPPLIPNDAAGWPFFAYVGGETFGDVADVAAERRQEFETLVLKLFPAHIWIVTLVEYV